ncbi:phospholipase A [Pseudidiomarina donghaiensis]|jgi:phospholipase A1|uniref:Phospholipase A1 n=1 Tax=Pseudidiomarina donghaiensis TaxID=519452 RepID=A0A432XH02_9GAMM|nr:phospholipase A [Pseudidiomarina donghaiensis]RUO47847.1 phospholipase [Pseudidiomarina donghaiensis]SFV22437.1 phospholipase A1 [Pseudidiomarina donghaiensis]
MFKYSAVKFGLLVGGLFWSQLVLAQDTSENAVNNPQAEVELDAEAFAETDLIGRFWELGEDQKRGIFDLRTFHPNFILPVHYSSNPNEQPSSPTRGPGTPFENLQPNEVKLQLSLRTKLVEDILLDGDIWVAYSQTSLWQAWNSDDSSPFRSTNYKPEVFYVMPWKEKWDFIPGDATVRFAKAGLAHESNGQRKPDSRSWNYIYFGGAVEWGPVIWETTWKQRVNEVGDDDDNPDLVRYRGNFENRFSWRNNLSTYSLTRITRELSWDKGSWQLDFTHPLNSDKPDGLRFYIQFFSGYGETLLDYNHRQNRIGIGFLLLNI